jgi:hypothetical protein
MSATHSSRSSLPRRCAIVFGLLVASVAAAWIAYVAVAAVPTRELDHAEMLALFGDHTQERPPAKLDQKFHKSVRRAQVDFFLHGVPELPGYHLITFLGAHRIRDKVFLEFAPNTSDAYLLYQCTTDGKILWRAYFFDGA